MMLCTAQAACSTQAPVEQNNQALLDFSDLANEITVGVERSDPRRDEKSKDGTPLETR